MRTLINKLRFFFYTKIFLKGGEMDMAMVYVTCIIHGLRTYKQVPQFLKKQVKELLIGMELGELVIED